MAPWEVLDLVSHHLDPKSLAISSCVCKSWFISLSSDHIRQPICASHFPYLSTLKLTNPTVPYQPLYVMGQAVAKRRLQTPSKPRISLDSLIFIVYVFNPNSLSNVPSLEKSRSEMIIDPNRIFKFDIDVSEKKGFEAWEDKDSGAVRVTWNVVLEGWMGAFGMMDCEGKGMEWWFSKELSSPAGCCSSVAGRGIVADLKLGHCDGRRVKKVSVGMLSVVDWRYMSVDDALKILATFSSTLFLKGFTLLIYEGSCLARTWVKYMGSTGKPWIFLVFAIVYWSSHRNGM